MNKIKFPRKEPPCRVFWCWDISYECNYKCSYCRVDTWRQTTYINIEKWKTIWDKIYEEYGSTHIRFSGGEPFIYPNFFELLKYLGEHHTLNITTNLSFDADKFIKDFGFLAEKACLAIASSYHPEYNKLDDFINKVLYLRSKGIYTSVSMVAWPPVLETIPKVKCEMEKNGIEFLLIPLGGHFFGKEYPEGYTEQERIYLEKLSLVVSNKTSKDMYNFKVKKEDRKIKERLCRMGMNFGLIRPNGDVFRCCTFEKCACLGNIMNGSFKLLDEPAACSLEPCNCYKAMLVGGEEKIKSDWKWAKNRNGIYYDEKG